MDIKQIGQKIENIGKNQKFWEVASLVLAIASYCFICVWYVAVICLILSVFFAVLYLRRDHVTKMLKIALILDGIFVVCLLLFLLFSAMYMGLIDSIQNYKS